MILYADNKIEITDAAGNPFCNDIVKKLTFNNPEYFKRQKMGKWLGNTPQTLCLAEWNRGNLYVPFGVLPYCFANRDRFEKFHSRFAPNLLFNYGSTIEPYDYQEEAIQEALRRRQGIIVAPCGSGKTQIGLEVAARLGMRTLWLTHTHDLLQQSMTRAKTYFNGLKDDDYGTITDGAINIGRVITFATVQTMSRINLPEFKNNWDVIITDEVHHVCGGPTRMMMFYRVLSELSARYKFGLTATPKRSDGLTGCMFAIVGPKIYEVTREQMNNALCPVVVKRVPTGFEPDIENVVMPDGTIAFNKLYNEICNSEERNNIVVDEIKNCVANGSVLVLTDRVFHAEIINSRLHECGIRAEILVGSTGKVDRKNAIANLEAGFIDVIIATYHLAKEGLDIPSLQYVFLATPQKNEITVTQSAGRVSRNSPGKDVGYIYDFVDDLQMLKCWSRKRDNIYRKLGFGEVYEVC